MKTPELLGTKKITRVLPAKLGLSISPVSSGGSWRFRVAILTDAFSFLAEPLNTAVAPRAVIEGDASNGLIISLTRHTGNSVSAQKSTVAFTQSCRSINAVESKVSQDNVDGLLIEVDGGDRYLITGPLPDKYLSTATREKRAKSGKISYPVYLNARDVFDALHPPKITPVTVETVKRETPAMTCRPSTPEVTPTPVETIKRPELAEATPPPTIEAPPPTIEAPPPEPVVSQTVMTHAPRPVKDLKDALDLFNDQVQQFRGDGAQVELYIDNDGMVRARLRMVIENTL